MKHIEPIYFLYLALIAISAVGTYFTLSALR